MTKTLEISNNLSIKDIGESKILFYKNLQWLLNLLNA